MDPTSRAIFGDDFMGGPPHEVMPGKRPADPHGDADVWLPVGWWQLIGGAWRWVTDPSSVPTP